MAGASVGGLVSGLDTATIISQLMQVEAQPQTMLKSRLSTEQSSIGTLQSLNAKFAALVTRAHDLAQITAWSPSKATSSSEKVTVNAGSAAVPGTLSFTVKQTATAHRISSLSTTAAGSDVVASTNAMVTKADGSTVAITTATGTLDELVTALNGTADAKVSASKIRLDDGTYRLSVVSTETGAASVFTLKNADGSTILGGSTTLTDGQDAKIVVGLDTISSASNTFTGLLQGIDVTLAPGAATATPIDITVSRDPAAAQQSLQGLVDAANDILTQIDKLTAYDPTTKASGPLAGDSVLRDLRTRVLDAVTRSDDGTSLAGLGVQTDRYGKITFDSTKFTSAYNADPAGVAVKLGTTTTTTTTGTTTTTVGAGFAARLEAAAKTASDASTGVLTQSIQGRQSSVTTMQDSIADWDVRLATKKDALSRQFAALEVSLSKMQNQASWLSGQINSLSSSSS
jgi:flagellar hook-associated protein 2